MKNEKIAPYLYYILPLIFIVTVSFFLVGNSAKKQILLREETRQHQELDSMKHAVIDVLSTIEAYIIHTSVLPGLHEFLISGDEKNRESLENYFYNLIDVNLQTNSPQFQQLRLLSSSGVELIRVDQIPGNKAVKISKEKLQDKSDRYYYINATTLEQNEIYISPLDLNIENGKIEIPFKPMIRFVYPIISDNGSKLGYFVANYQAVQIFTILDNLNIHESDSIILLNQNGEYLHSPHSDKNFSFMFEDSTELSFAEEYPEQWKAIDSDISTTTFFDQGKFFSTRITPFSEQVDTLRSTEEISWILVMSVPVNTTSIELQALRKVIINWGMVALILAITTGFLLAKLKNKNIWFIKELEKSATTDDLTGLLNRRAIFERLKYTVDFAKRMNGELSICFIDLDNLKLANDRFGHSSGDKLIILASKAINIKIRKTDIAARLGGDEFLIILPQLNEKDASIVVGRIITYFEIEAKKIFDFDFSLSWGISQWDGADDRVDNIIARADKAMYRMKKEKKKTQTDNK